MDFLPELRMERDTALSDDRRSEISSFLRRRRDRLQPADVGLPPTRRRRTPGLRREEVAALAGVSTEWYKWLEQARAVRPSEDALRRIAGALRLEPGESRHLLKLAGYGVAAAEQAQRGVIGDHLRRLLHQLEPSPAWVYGERWDIVGWNRAAKVIHGDLDAMPDEERNGAWQMFLGERLRGTLVDWRCHASGLVGKMRAAHAQYVEDPWFNELVRTLLQRSPDFAAMWAAHEVTPYQDGTKHYDHPDAGRLSFEYTVLRVTDERYAALSLTAYVPLADTDTRAKMEALLEGSVALA